MLLNLLPVPGLDGYDALEPHLSPETQRALAPAKQYGFFILLIVLAGGQPVDLRGRAVVLRSLRSAARAGGLGQLADPVLEPLDLTLAIYALVRIYYCSWAPVTVTPRPRPTRLG